MVNVLRGFIKISGNSSFYLYLLISAPIYAAQQFTIGVLAFRGNDQAIAQWNAHAQYLSDSIPDADFRIVPLDLQSMTLAVRDGSVDFILTNPGHYVTLESLYGISRILTLRNLRHGQPLTEFGSVIFSRKEDASITGLSDLSGKRFSAVSKGAVGGFEMAWLELDGEEFNPFDDFESINYLGFHQGQIVEHVLNGKADAGTVRTGVLERMSDEGRLNIDQDMMEELEEVKTNIQHIIF